MTILLLALIALGVVAALSYRKTDEAPVAAANGDCASCSGSNDRCEQVCMAEAATKAPEYFDDEELDVFSGRPSDGYSDDEAELFREVLYSMRPDEVAAWNRSLILRQVSIPDQLKDEVVMLISAERQ